eukprot:2507065-Pleurochrysis_carterae.AAC.1
MDELQSRDPAKTFTEWRNEQEVYQYWLQHADETFDFVTLHDEYLARDVDCLWHLVRIVGTYFQSEEALDIRTNSTVGSISEKLWIRTLDAELPKLQLEAQHQRWQRANRGGWCSVLHSFDYTAQPGESIYTVDVTSLYPASSMNIRYVTELGEQRPLYHWYNGFPDPREEGWLVRDFDGTDRPVELKK